MVRIRVAINKSNEEEQARLYTRCALVSVQKSALTHPTIKLVVGTLRWLCSARIRADRASHELPTRTSQLMRAVPLTVTVSERVICLTSAHT